MSGPSTIRVWYQKPTIAMVNGWCFGGGHSPLFGSDLAFAADDAQFGLGEINWAILPGGGATKVAIELLPLRKAMYHAMMGENISGAIAAEWGLVNEPVPADALKARVTAVAEVLRLIETRLARYKVPKHVSIVAALPRNGAGKVMKAELKRLLASTAEEPPPGWSARQFIHRPSQSWQKFTYKATSSV